MATIGMLGVIFGLILVGIVVFSFYGVVRAVKTGNVRTALPLTAGLAFLVYEFFGRSAVIAFLSIALTIMLLRKEKLKSVVNKSPRKNFYVPEEETEEGAASEGEPVEQDFVKTVKETFDKYEKAMSFVTAVLALLFVHFVLWHVMGFFTTAFYILLITAVTVFIRKKDFEFCGFHKVTVAVLYLFSFVFSVTANNFIKILDVIFLLMGTAYLIYSVTNGKKSFGRFLPFEMGKSLTEYPMSSFSKEYSAVNSTLKQSGFGKNAKLVVLGLIIAVPLTYIVGSLLMSADSGVEKILNAIAEAIHFENILTLLFEFAVSIPIGGYLFGMLFSSVRKESVSPLDENKCENLCSKMKIVNNTVIYTAVTPICILYLIFFFSQVSYFISGFSGNLPDGYSYAEYARRGFFELFAIELINAVVIFCMNLFAQKSGKSKSAALKFYTVLISLFTLVITATAVSKMVLYIKNYGFTQLRVYTTWFMILTAVIFIYTIILQFKTNFRFTNAVCVTFTVMFALLCFSRPDALITQYNLTYFSDSMTYNDLIEMKDMSDDAAAVLLKNENQGAVEKICRDTYRDEWFYDTNIYSWYDDDYYDIENEYSGDEFRKQCAENTENDTYALFNLSGLLIRDRIGQYNYSE